MSHMVAGDVLALHKQSKAEIETLSKSPAIQNPKPQRPMGTPLTTLFSSLTVAVSASVEKSPTPRECTVHLELLEVFLQLRLRVLNSQNLDKTFGIHEIKKTVYRKTFVGWSPPTVSGRRRTKKFENKAVKIRDAGFQERRRQKWPWFLRVAVQRFFIWVVKADAVLCDFDESSSLALPLRCLPPLDVLMVWHAFLLNPRDFAAFCEEQRVLRIRKIPFPWKQIHSAINMRSLTYTLPPAAVEWHTITTHLAADLFSHLINDGTARSILAHMDSTSSSSSSSSYIHVSRPHPSELEKRHAAILSSPDDDNNPSKTNTMILLRAYASHHYRSSSAFSRELLCRPHPLHQQVHQNVIRQVGFIDKMHSHLWIRSPAVLGTARRAVDRYHSFVKLFALYPGKMLVPTLDVDLAWHTHQCSALSYQTEMLEKTGRFIDHDDKLSPGPLADGLEETRELFMVRFGETYQVCLCWDCQAIMDCVEEEGDEDMEEVVKRARENVKWCRAEELTRRKMYPMK